MMTRKEIDVFYCLDFSEQCIILKIIHRKTGRFSLYFKSILTIDALTIDAFQEAIEKINPINIGLTSNSFYPLIISSSLNKAKQIKIFRTKDVEEVNGIKVWT